jgi:glycosyltransferase involved in cell wall biosynthesis
VAARDKVTAQWSADKARGAGHQDARQTRSSNLSLRPDGASDVCANALKRPRSQRKAGSSRVVHPDHLPSLSSPSAAPGAGRRPKLLFLVTEDWYFCSHRLPVARAAQAAGFAVAVATRVREHGDLIRDEGFALHPIAWQRRGDGLLGAARAISAIAQLYRRERPNVIHHVALKPVLFGGIARRLAFANPANAPTAIDSVMGLGSGFSRTGATAGLRRPPLALALRLVMGGSRRWVVVQNPEDRAALVRLGIGAGRIVLIKGSGVDTHRFAPLPEPEGDTVTVALVSRMLRDKGVLDAAAAIRRLRAQGVAVELLLAGPTDPDNANSLTPEVLRSLAAEPGIEWLGPVADVRAVWRRAAIAVLPSTYGEGVPKTLLEAAACGRPLVAADVPGCREIVRPGETGILVRPHDIEGLASGIAALAGDRAHRAALGQAGRQLIESLFTDKIVARETLALYHTALAERGDFAAVEKTRKNRSRAGS